jgi:hypothetical protein
MRILSLLIAISAWTGTALAQLPTPTINVPVVGLASTETAQVNVTYLIQPTLAILPLASPPAATSPCTGTVAFFNSAGYAIGNPASFSLSTGQIYSTTLPYADVTGTSGTARTVVRAIVTPTAACNLNTSIETFDTATGVTHVHVEGPSVGIFPNLHVGVAR